MRQSLAGLPTDTTREKRMHSPRTRTSLVAVIGPIYCVADPRSAAPVWSLRGMAVSSSGAQSVVLEIEPESWWLGWLEGKLIVEAIRIESYIDEHGGTWAVVEGWRLLPGGGRRWTRDLVRATAVPFHLMAGAGV